MNKKNTETLKAIHNKREQCRLCSSKDLSQVLALASIPIGEKYYQKKPDKEDSRFPIDLYQCGTCQAVQTLDDIDNEYLWSNYILLAVLINLHLVFRAIRFRHFSVLNSTSLSTIFLRIEIGKFCTLAFTF